VKRILVTGGRDYSDIEMVEKLLLAAVERLRPCSDGDIVVTHGDCKYRLANGEIDPTRSADHLAAGVAERMGWVNDPRPVTAADYARWGRHEAPKRRNTEMVALGPDICVAFPGGGGTADCARKAKAAGIPIMTVASLP
jgi:hypothetical protein